MQLRFLGYALILSAATFAVAALFTHTWAGRILFGGPAGAAMIYGIGFLAITRGQR